MRRNPIDPARLGQCYKLSYQYVYRLYHDGIEDGVRLVHGSIEGFGNPRIGHAWVVVPEGIWEPASNEVWDPVVWEAMFDPIEIISFTPLETLVQAMRFRHYGPWHDAEPVAPPRPRKRRRR